MDSENLKRVEDIGIESIKKGTKLYRNHYTGVYLIGEIITDRCPIPNCENKNCRMRRVRLKNGMIDSYNILDEYYVDISHVSSKHLEFFDIWS